VKSEEGLSQRRKTNQAFSLSKTARKLFNSKFEIILERLCAERERDWFNENSDSLLKGREKVCLHLLLSYTYIHIELYGEKGCWFLELFI